MLWHEGWGSGVCKMPVVSLTPSRIPHNRVIWQTLRQIEYLGTWSHYGQVLQSRMHENISRGIEL